MNTAGLACYVDPADVHAEVIHLNGRPTIRLRTGEGWHLGYFPSPAAVAAAGYDLSALTLPEA